MRVLAVVVLFSALTWSQEPSASASSPSQTTESHTITVPAGTRIPLSLTSPVTYKAVPGATIRAVTGFPITVGTQLAIPVGTYVDGVIDKVTKGGRSGPSMQMHFTRLVYPNGYSVAVDGVSTQARLVVPGAVPDETFGLLGGLGAGSSLVAQQAPPPLPPLPKPSSHVGAFIGAAVGGVAAVVLTIVLLGHHRGGGNAILFETGWQFAMVLQNPLTIDASSVAPAQ